MKHNRTSNHIRSASAQATDRPTLRDRHGTAAVEFAVCLPAIVLLMLGSLETANMIFLKESLATAGYEAARTAAKYNSESAEVIAKADNLLDARDVKSANISIEPSDISSAVRGDIITVTVAADCDSNSILPLRFLAGQTISIQTTMVRE